MSTTTSPRPLRFGLQVATAPDAAGWVDAARGAEADGFSTLLVPDHFARPLAPWSAMAVAAAVTTKLRVGTLLLNNDFRHPVVVAREAATLQLLSQGRLELGLGAGWNRSEYEETGFQFDRPAVRVDRLEESIAIVKALLAGEAVTHSGEHYSIKEHSIEQSQGELSPPTLVVGGNGNRVLALAARDADVVSLLGVTVRPDGSRDFSSFTDVGLRRKLAVLDSAAPDRPDRPELSAYVWHMVPGPNAEEAAGSFARDESLSVDDVLQSPFVLFGTAGEMAEKVLKAREEYDLSYWIVNARGREAMARVIHELEGQE